MATKNSSVSARDAKRNIGEELLQAIKDVKAGNYGAKCQVEANDTVQARMRCGLSQAQFAAALHISRRARSSSGSRGGVSRQARRKRCLRSLPSIPKCCVT